MITGSRLSSLTPVTQGVLYPIYFVEGHRNGKMDRVERYIRAG